METPFEQFRQKIFDQIDKTCEEFLKSDESKQLTITEFCIEVDDAKTLTDINMLENYLWIHGRKYSLIELRFIVEHLNTKKWLLK